MRIERENAEPVEPGLWVVMTREEADQLFTALLFYFDDWDQYEAGWHHHLGPAKELTIEIEADTGPEALAWRAALGTHPNKSAPASPGTE
jgi:hypothetical protein